MINTKKCPLCNKDNRCGLNHNIQEQCWCVSENITPTLLAKVPQPLINKSCICQACIDKFNAVEIIDKS